MYVGHVAIAMALRAEGDAPPLWLLVLAAQGPDWGDTVVGWLDRPIGDPGWSPHGLPLIALGAVCSAILAALLMLATRHRAGAAAHAALLGALAYASHWIADLFTGVKPTWPGGPMVGLGWYGIPGRDLALESAVIVGGWWLWHRSLPVGRRHALAWALLAALLGLQLAADVVMARGTLLG